MFSTFQQRVENAKKWMWKTMIFLNCKGSVKMKTLSNIQQ